MAEREPSTPLPREVKVLGAVSLAQDSASEMMYPLLPTFITGVLGAPVVAIGVAEGLADATAAVMKLVSGRLARAGKRRPWIAAGYGLAAAGKVIVALAFVWPVVVLGRVVDRLGKGIRGTPRDALIADVCDDTNRGRGFGLHRSMDTTGAVIGPLLGLAVYHAFDEQIRPALLLAVIPAVISVALVGLVRDHVPGGAAPDITAGRGEGADPPLRDDQGLDDTPLDDQADDDPPREPLGPAFWRVMVPLGIFALVNSTDALLLQRATELGFSLPDVVLVYVLYNVVYAALGYPAGHLSDRVPHRLVFGVGLVVFGITYIGLGQVTSSAAVWLLLPLYGVFTAMTDGVSRAWVSRLVPVTQRTWALGVYGGWTGFGVLLAGLWSGLLWQGTGELPLTVSGIVALCVAAWLLLGMRTQYVRSSTTLPSGSLT